VKRKAKYWVGNKGDKFPADSYSNNGGGREIPSQSGGILKDLPSDGYPYTLEYEELPESEKTADMNKGVVKKIWRDAIKDASGKTIIKEGWCFIVDRSENSEDEVDKYVRTVLSMANKSGKRLAKALANWLTGPITAYMNEKGYKDGHSPSIFFSSTKIRELATYVEFTDYIDFGTAKRKVFPRLVSNFGDETVFDIMDEMGLWSKSDDNEVEQLIDDVLLKFPEEVERFKNGEEKLFGMLMGQVMRNKGDMSFNAKDANVLLRKKLSS
jgi:hypothetical protein